MDKLVAVKQIMSADGWHALFEQKDDTYDRDPLVCWILVQREDPVQGIYDGVEGMAIMDGLVDYCEESPNFCGYCQESELDKYPEATYDEQDCKSS